MQFNNTLPIYQQICQHFEAQILSGKLSLGSKVDSVRDLALELGVNPNTMQKALAALETQGLMRSERTSGRFITEDAQIVEALRQSKTVSICENFFLQMDAIGINQQQAYDCLGKCLS